MKRLITCSICGKQKLSRYRYVCEYHYAKKYVVKSERNLIK